MIESTLDAAPMCGELRIVNVLDNCVIPRASSLCEPLIWRCETAAPMECEKDKRTCSSRTRSSPSGGARPPSTGSGHVRRVVRAGTGSERSGRRRRKSRNECRETASAHALRPVSRLVKAMTPVEPLVIGMSRLDAALPIIGPPSTTVERSSSVPTVSKMKRSVVPIGIR